MGVVVLEGCTDDAILSNQDFGNTGAGIGLNSDGVTPNTPDGLLTEVSQGWETNRRYVAMEPE